MKRVLVLALCVFMILGVFAGCGTNKAFSVGYAAAEITPPLSVPLAGLGDSDSRFSSSTMDKLYATCVACTDSKGNTVLMFGLDLLHTQGAVFNDVRQRISKETKIPFENIMFSASHTHSGPEMNTGYAPDAIQKSNEHIAEQCYQAAMAALEDRSPAKMSATFTRTDRLNFVRHYVLEDGSYRGWRVWEAGQKVLGHPHKADNLLQLVKFTREEGKKDVIMINWQAHYAGADDVNYNAFSSDYIGILRQTLEKELDCYTTYFQGGAGNVSCGSRIKGEAAATNYVQQGEMMAQYVLDVKDNFQELALGNIQVLSETFSTDSAPEGTPIYAISFGDFACVFAPFEVFDNNAKTVRETSKFKYTFYASCSNTSWGNRYLPDLEAYRYPAYESCGHGEAKFNYAPFGKGAAEKLEAQFITMLDSIFATSGNEVKEKDEGYLTPEFVPVSDDVEYLNPNPGDFSVIQEGEGGNNLYRLALYKHGERTPMLADSRETAELVLSQSTMKLLFDERNVIVGIAE